MEEFKKIDLKNLDKESKDIVRYMNQQIIEHQSVFNEEPLELLISKRDFTKLSGEEEYKYLLLGERGIKIYSV